MSDDKHIDHHLDRRCGTARWIDRGFLLAVLLACAVAVSPNLADPDLWGHVRYGLDVFQDGALPATTSYAYTVDNFRWINHENLSELIFAAGAAAVGGRGLLFGKCLLGLLVVGAVMRQARRQGAQLITIAGVALLVAVNLTYHWSVRPQIFTFALYAALLMLLSRCFDGWEGQWHLPWLRRCARAGGAAADEPSLPHLRWLWLAPVLFCVWANTHGGFAAGYCIFAAILGCRAVEALAVKGRRAWGLVYYLVFMLVASGLATLINPYGPQLQVWVLRSLGEPRPEITEWLPLGFSSPHLLPFLLLVAAAAAALIASRKPLDLTHLVLLALTFWQSCEHQRHIPFFALSVGFWLPRHFESMLARWRKSTADPSLAAGMSPALRGVVIAGLIGTYALLGWRLHDRLSMLRVERHEYPVAALQYMVDHQLFGRTVVTFNWAQYAIAALDRHAPEPGAQVAFDGRFRTCYPQEIVDMHFDFLLGAGPGVQRHRSENSPAPDGGRVLRFRHPELVLIDRAHPHAVAVMRRHADQWLPVYQDPVAEVWVRADLCRTPSDPLYVAPHERVTRDTWTAGAVAWPALPVGNRRHRGPAPPRTREITALERGDRASHSHSVNR